MKLEVESSRWRLGAGDEEISRRSLVSSVEVLRNSLWSRGVCCGVDVTGEAVELRGGEGVLRGHEVFPSGWFKDI